MRRLLMVMVFGWICGGAQVVDTAVINSRCPADKGRVIMRARHGVEIRWSPKIGTYRLER